MPGPRTAYKRGRAFELRVRKYLEKLGWLVVRSPMSRGPFDLIAVSHGSVLLLQCKAGAGNRINPLDWNKLYDIAEQSGSLPLFVTRRKNHALEFHELVGRKTTRGRQPMVPVRLGEASRDQSAVVAM